MTDYDNLVFAFIWCDLAKYMGFHAKRLQEKNIQVSDVGRSITSLCNRLKTEYTKGSEFPATLPFVDGYGNHILQQLFAENAQSITSFTANLLNDREIAELEETLRPEHVEESTELEHEPVYDGRSTRKKTYLLHGLA
jgi:hypothetical protein